LSAGFCQAGASLAARHRSFAGGKLKIRDDGLLAVNPDTRVEHTPFTNNWWEGLSMLHHLFVREHNSICDFLKSKFPAWTDDELFGYMQHMKHMQLT